MLIGACCWSMAAARASGSEITAIIGVSEQFGTIEYLRIAPSNLLEICRQDHGKLLLRRLLDKPDEPIRRTLKELSDELGRLTQSGWPKPKDQDPADSISKLPVDGPQWHFYLISRDKEIMEVRDLAGYSRVGGLISLLHQNASQRGVPQPLVSGVLLDWSPPGETSAKAARVWRVRSAPTIRLLNACGALVINPLPKGLDALLAGKEDNATIHVSDQSFTLQRVRP